MMRLLVVLLCASCSYYRTIGEQPDAGPPDAAPPSVDAPQGLCANECSAAGTTTVCIQGLVCHFTQSSTPASPAEAALLRVRVYDPIAFETNPGGTLPLATATIDSLGCFVADGVPRPSSGLILWTVDDAGPGDQYSTFFVSAVLQNNRNLTGQKAYAIPRSTVAQWQTQIGSVPGCTGTLEDCGLWIGEYLDRAGNPVAGVRPTRPGDDPPLANVFCFRGDRMHLSTEDITDGTGLCAISPDSVEAHAGACAATGCSGTWPSMSGGAAPHSIGIQTFVAQ